MGFSFGQKINQSHLQDLREATKQALGVYPYFVSMNQQELPEIDAVSSYIGGRPAIEGSDYVTSLANAEKDRWKAWAAQSIKQIPTVSAGNDARPRAEYKMPWGPQPWSAAYVKDPTMLELENHVTD